MAAVTIRPLREEDAAYFADEERKQGWHTEEGKFLDRLRDVRAGICISLVAELDGVPAGYVNVYHEGDFAWTPFAGAGFPEIVDFTVLEKFRGRGVGSALMDEAERVAGAFSDTVFLGVGLHAGYGSAQRMYVKRGYIPDGSGVWFRGRVCEPYTPCENDDDLVLYLSKKLR